MHLSEIDRGHVYICFIIKLVQSPERAILK